MKTQVMPYTETDTEMSCTIAKGVNGWSFLWNGQPSRLHEGKTFYESLDELVEDFKRLGFVVTRRKNSLNGGYLVHTPRAAAAMLLGYARRLRLVGMIQDAATFEMLGEDTLHKDDGLGPEGVDFLLSLWEGSSDSHPYDIAEWGWAPSSIRMELGL